MKDSFTIFRWTLTFLVAASFARPAPAASPATEASARLLAQIEPRFKAIYERDEFAILKRLGVMGGKTIPKRAD